jgi:hypothetical protein
VVDPEEGEALVHVSGLSAGVREWRIHSQWEASRELANSGGIKGFESLINVCFLL